MADATIIVLPVIRIERYLEDGSCEVVQPGVHAGTGKQVLLPSSDRRNIVELWRVRLDREYEALGHAMGASLDAIARTRVSKEE